MSKKPNRLALNMFERDLARVGVTQYQLSKGTTAFGVGLFAKYIRAVDSCESKRLPILELGSGAGDVAYSLVYDHKLRVVEPRKEATYLTVDPDKHQKIDGVPGVPPMFAYCPKKKALPDELFVFVNWPFDVPAPRYEVEPPPCPWGIRDDSGPTMRRTNAPPGPYDYAFIHTHNPKYFLLVVDLTGAAGSSELLRWLGRKGIGYQPMTTKEDFKDNYVLVFSTTRFGTCILGGPLHMKTMLFVDASRVTTEEIDNVRLSLEKLQVPRLIKKPFITTDRSTWNY